jgi:hypothetical protein
MPHITRCLYVITPHSHLTIQKIDTYNAEALVRLFDQLLQLLQLGMGAKGLNSLLNSGPKVP